MEIQRQINRGNSFGTLEKEAKAKLQNDNDVKIIIQGRNSQTGIGKTTLAIKLARAIDPNWKAETRAFVDVREYLNAFLEVPKGSVLLLDEIEHGADSRRAMAEDNVQLSQGWAKLRARNVATIATLPSVSMLDKRMLELADYWVLVKNRGLAQPYRISVNDFKPRRMPQRIGLGDDGNEHITFEDLPDDDEDKEYLDRIKDEIIREGAMESISITEHERRVEKEIEDAKREYRDEILTALVEQTELTLREIAELDVIDISHRRVGQIAAGD